MERSLITLVKARDLRAGMMRWVGRYSEWTGLIVRVQLRHDHPEQAFVAMYFLNPEGRIQYALFPADGKVRVLVTQQQQ